VKRDSKKVAPRVMISSFAKGEFFYGLLFEEGGRAEGGRATGPEGDHKGSPLPWTKRGEEAWSEGWVNRSRGWKELP
jgi:hypothetical protein